MANRRNYYRRSHKGLAVFCVILVLIIAAGGTLGGLELWGKDEEKPSNWFKKDKAPAPTETVQEYETTLPANGGMTLPETVNAETEDETGNESKGIALMSAAVPVAQYSDYGASPAAETVKTVTATVSPDNEASNTKIKWEIAWKNPDSEWATGKEISDYITLYTNAEDLMESKKCTLSCTQAFGEQAVLKAIAVDDETKFATSNIDYVQQVNSVKVFIGDISVNLGGNTDITIVTRRAEGGAGGEVKVAPRLGDVYTIKSEFSTHASLSHVMRNDGDEKWLAYYQYIGGPQGSSTLTYNDDDDLTGDSIYFDRRLFTQFNFYCGGTHWDGGDLSPSDDTLFTSIEQATDLAANFNGGLKGKVIWTLKISLTSGAYSYTYESDIVWAAIDETVPLEDVDIGKDIVFP